MTATIAQRRPVLQLKGFAGSPSAHRTTKGASALPLPSYTLSGPFSVSLVNIGPMSPVAAPTLLAKGVLAPFESPPASACRFSAAVSTEGTRDEGAPTSVGVGDAVDMIVRGCRSASETSSSEEEGEKRRLSKARFELAGVEAKSFGNRSSLT